jgi:hypothetical protein
LAILSILTALRLGRSRIQSTSR